MSGGEFAAIEARANAASAGPWTTEPSKYIRQRYVTTRSESRTIWHATNEVFEPADAEFIAHAREDVPALLAAVRERDNTITRVRDIVESVHMSDDLDPDGYQVAGLIRAALDPQETPDGRM